MNVTTGLAVLITGGTGSLGRALVRSMLAEPIGPARIRVFSRDEVKQAEMRAEFHDDHRLRFLIGDVRDEDRVKLAVRDVDHVIHCAALKRVEACAYSPMEAVRTNVIGTWNVLRAALDSRSVKRVLAISSDKACSPLNLYGKTKACMEELVTDANAYVGLTLSPKFSSVRYGNVAGSRGSVIPLWRKLIAEGKPVPIMDPRATRFWFTLPAAVRLVMRCLNVMEGGEVFVPDLKAFSVTALAGAMGARELVTAPPRPGDKTNELMVSEDEAPYFRKHFPGYVRPWEFGQRPAERFEPLPPGFRLSSETAPRMGGEELVDALKEVE